MGRAITELPAATTLTGSELLPVVQDGQTRKALASTFLRTGERGPEGPPGGVGPAGPSGPAGPQGPSSGVVVTQITPSASWVIPHSFGRLPGVQITNAAGRVVFPDVIAGPSSVSVVFAVPATGTATLF